MLRLPPRLGTHVWTMAGPLLAPFRSRAPVAVPWETEVADDHHGQVRLTGLYRAHPESRGLLLVVHGLGGTADGHYCRRAALAAEAAGLSCLRLTLRGADGSGLDVYHAALTADLHAALASPEGAAHERVFALGFSLGGHVSLRLAAEDCPRLGAVAAACPPLDLARSAHRFDHQAPALYRRYVLRRLIKVHALLAARGRAHSSMEEVGRIRSVREFDQLVIVPRYGFADVDDYYARASATAVLSALRVPALIVSARHDPIVPGDLSSEIRAAANERLHYVPSLRGGHCCFAPNVDLGLGPARGLETQMVHWLLQQGREIPLRSRTFDERQAPSAPR